MAKGVKPRVKVPKSASAGETITIKTLISHKMESGQRKDKEGNVIPRSIINRFTCDFDGQSVIDVTMEPAISTNPYFNLKLWFHQRVSSNLLGMTMMGLSMKSPRKLP